MTRSALRALVLSAATTTAFACSLWDAQGSSSTDDCDRSRWQTCVDRGDAWTYILTQPPAGVGGAVGAGGAISISGAAGAPAIPASGCPGRDIATYPFMSHFGMPGSTIDSVSEVGTTCCYVTTAICEGRPLLVAGRRRVSSLVRRAAWV